MIRWYIDECNCGTCNAQSFYIKYKNKTHHCELVDEIGDDLIDVLLHKKMMIWFLWKRKLY